MFIVFISTLFFALGVVSGRHFDEICKEED